MLIFTNSSFHSVLCWFAGYSSFPFMSLPLDLQWKIIDALAMDDFLSLKRSSKAIAATINEQHSEQHVESGLRSYLEPRGLFSTATCHSILALCGSRGTTEGDKKAGEVHAEALKKMLCSGLSHSWQQTYLRFPLAALSPFKLFFHQYASHFRSEGSLCGIAIQDLHQGALEILEKTTKSCSSSCSDSNSRDMNSSTAESQLLALEGECLCNSELLEQYSSELFKTKNHHGWFQELFKAIKKSRLDVMNVQYSLMQTKEEQILMEDKITHQQVEMSRIAAVIYSNNDRSFRCLEKRSCLTLKP